MKAMDFLIIGAALLLVYFAHLPLIATLGGACIAAMLLRIASGEKL